MTTASDFWIFLHRLENNTRLELMLNVFDNSEEQFIRVRISDLRFSCRIYAPPSIDTSRLVLHVFQLTDNSSWYWVKHTAKTLEV